MRRPGTHQPRRPDRYVYAVAPRCPFCGSKRLLANRTTRNGDGSITRHANCGDCLEKLILIIE